MRFHLVSDLHLDFWDDKGQSFLDNLDPQDCSTLVIAGDLGEGPFLLEWGEHIFRTLCRKYNHVIYVAGNHEYYNSDFETMNLHFKALDEEFPNLIYLENNQAIVEGVIIAGTTLWFRNTPMNALYENRLADFDLIQDFRDQVYVRNVEAMEFLRDRSVRGTELVITHHLPTTLSVNKRYATAPTNLYFLCDVSETMLDLEPKVWVHGHTHIPCDYMLGKTKVLCHPRGYPSEFGRTESDYFPKVVEI